MRAPSMQSVTPRTTILASAVLVASVSAVHAGQFTDAERSLLIALGSFNGPDPLSVDQFGLGGFDEHLQQDYFDDFSGGYASGEVSQQSTIGPRSLSATGSTYAFGSTDEIGLSRTNLTTQFNVSAADVVSGTFLLIDSELGEPGGFNLGVVIRDSSEKSVFEFGYYDLVMVDGALRMDWSFMLDAGSYELDFTIRNTSFKDTYNQGDYDLTMSIPSPSGVGVFVLAGLGLGATRRR